MNNQARSCKLKCRYNIQGICHAYGECIAKELFIEELEKIREKISKLTRYYTTENGHINLVSDNAVYRIIDKEISELKGENNDTTN